MALHPFFIWLAIMVMVTPAFLAYRVDREIRAFQEAAFGHLARAARNFRWMVWAIFVYYLGVLIGSASIGQLQDMMRYPMPGEGMVIYIRIGAAVLGYVMASFVARELFLVTQPDPIRAQQARR